jgi:hypothetical protein
MGRITSTFSGGFESQLVKTGVSISRQTGSNIFMAVVFLFYNLKDIGFYGLLHLYLASAYEYYVRFITRS